jgi:hypothetical protein
MQLRSTTIQFAGNEIIIICFNSNKNSSNKCGLDDPNGIKCFDVAMKFYDKTFIAALQDWLAVQVNNFQK